MTAFIDCNNTGTIINVPTPTNSSDACTKGYADALIPGGGGTSGTFTPTILGLTTAGTPTYTSRTAIWKKEATGLCTVFGNLRISATGGMTGQIALGGLNDTCGTIAGFAGIGWYANNSGTLRISGEVQQGTNQIYLYKDGAGGMAPLTVADLTATFRVDFAAMYSI